MLTSLVLTGTVLANLAALYERGHTPNQAFFDYSKSWVGNCAYADAPDAAVGGLAGSYAVTDDAIGTKSYFSPVVCGFCNEDQVVGIVFQAVAQGALTSLGHDGPGHAFVSRMGGAEIRLREAPGASVNYLVALNRCVDPVGCRLKKDAFGHTVAYAQGEIGSICYYEEIY